MFSLLWQTRLSCWKYWNWFSHIKNWYHQTKMVEKKRIIFLVSPYCTLLFPKKGNIKFSEVALVADHCSCLSSCIMIAWGCCSWNTTNSIVDIYLLVKKEQFKPWSNMQSLLNFIKKCNRIIGCRLASVFLNNLERLSHLSQCYYFNF